MNRTHTMKNRQNKFFIRLFLFSFFYCSAQTGKLKQQIDSLQYVNSSYFFECNSSHWKIIAAKEQAIPYLIEKLDDETVTKAIHKCKTGPMKVGDVAYVTLSQILNLPLFLVTQQQFDWFEKGCQGGVFDYIDKNRGKFKSQVKAYYLKNLHKMKFIKFRRKELNECQKQNKITGYYNSY